jgi:hypothetical protein
LLTTLWPANPHIVISSHASMVPLEIYIKEVLQRSCVTYSTLLTAFHYLRLLQSGVPRANSRICRQTEHEQFSPLACQRRMFLSAVMLAWKYTQDKCYSSRQWARISGLCLTEINSNEGIFLQRVCWCLYIPQAVLLEIRSDVDSYIYQRQQRALINT